MVAIAVSDLDAILLDFDGTILDTTEELCHAVATAANRMAVMSALPPFVLHHTDIITKYPNLFGGPLEEFFDAIIAPHYQNNHNDGDGDGDDDNADVIDIDGEIQNKENKENKDQKQDQDQNQYDHAQSTQQFIQFFLDAIQDHDTPCSAFPDVLPALQHLHTSYPSLLFGVATTKPTPQAEQDLTSSSIPPNLRPLLTHVQGTDPGITPKPSPEVLLRCATRLGVDIRRTIYIGDTKRDVLAAKAAGCVACLTVRRKGEDDGTTYVDTSLGADGLIHSFWEIKDALNNIIPR